MSGPERVVKQIFYEDKPEASAQEILCCAYGRYSTDHQSSSSSDEQINNVIRAVAQKRVKSLLFPGVPLKVTCEFKDDAVSGASMAGRDGLERALTQIRLGRCKIILVSDFKRFLRGMSTALELYDFLQEHGAELIATSDGFSSASPNARTQFMGRALASEEFLEATSTDTRRGLDERRYEGLSDGHLWFGVSSRATKSSLVKGRMQPSHFDYYVLENQAEIVRRIFRMAADGYSQQAIARTLNGEGILPPAHYDKEGNVRINPNRGLEFRDRSIWQVLNNKALLGVIERKKTRLVKRSDGTKHSIELPRSQWIVVERPDLQIVSQELWDAVRVRIAEYSARKAAAGVAKNKPFKNDGYATHALTGMFTCAECGDAVVVVSGHRGGYYGCQRASRLRTCGFHACINCKKLETQFFAWIIDQVMSQGFCAAVADKYNEARRERSTGETADLTTKQARLTEVNASLANIVRAVEQGAASSVLLARLADLERERDGLVERLKYLQGVDKNQVYVTPGAIRSRMAALPTLLQQAGPFEVQRALKPLLAGCSVRLEGRDKAQRGEVGKSKAKKQSLWLVGSINLGRLLSHTAAGELGAAERASAEVRIEMRLD